MSTEFFRVRRVSEALHAFAPARRTAIEDIELSAALGRVAATDLNARAPLPGFARATVDGYAVRASDTYGASDSLPAYVAVAARMAVDAPPGAQLGPGQAAAIPTGGAVPPGADAVVMVEHTSEAASGTIEVNRPAAPGDGLVEADEDVRQGQRLVPEGRRLRAQDIGLLAAAGLASVPVRKRPVVGIVSTGDELVPPNTDALRPGQVRDATALALAAIIVESGAIPEQLGIAPDEPARLRRILVDGLDRSDILVVSAGSSVGARDVTAEAVASLGEPGIWCHGLAIKPGKPTLLAECGDVPVIGLPGNPLSALVVFRLLGAPLIETVAGNSHRSQPPTVSAHLTRDVPSAAGRLDIVQVELDGEAASPLFGKSALLSTLALADGQVTVPEEVSGLVAGSGVEVELHG